MLTQVKRVDDKNAKFAGDHAPVDCIYSLFVHMLINTLAHKQSITTEISFGVLFTVMTSFHDKENFFIKLNE